MKAKSRQSGFTLTEMMVVIGTIAVLAVFGVPAVRSFLHSFESRSGTKAMIEAALGSARAIAAKEQRYAGIRFQKAYDPEGPFKAKQYMVFIVQDPDIGAYFFRAVKGLKPIKLPDSVGVMDLKYLEVIDIVDNANFITLPNGWPITVVDTTTFSIVFSPSGKLVVHEVQVRNRQGIPDTEARRGDTSYDDVFNKKGDVDKSSAPLIAMEMGKEIGMFYQDDYYGGLNTPSYPDLVLLGPNPDLGLGREPSRNSFVIYDRKSFKQAYDKGLPWSDYLVTLVPEIHYINAYTGTIISKD